MKQRTVSTNEYKAVANIVAKYIEAIRIGSIDMLAESFHNDSVTYGFVNGELIGGASNPAVDFIKNYGKSPDIDAQIDVLDITPATAIARVVTGNDAVGSDCTEYLTLLKLDTGWSIIAKAFYQFDK